MKVIAWYLIIEFENSATLTDGMLQIALGGLEAGAHFCRLLIGGARRKLRRKLGLERPLCRDDDIGARRAPARLIGRLNGHHRLGQITHLDLRGDLALDHCGVGKTH